MKLIRVLYITTVSIFLVSCDKNMSDLDKYFADAKLIPPQQIEPLPEINSPEIFLYNAEDLRDPFSNDLQISEESEGAETNVVDGEGPDLNRRKETLENYPLDGLYMAGTYLQGDDFWGLIEDPEGDLHRVSEGEYLGQNYGRISQVSEHQILLSEWLADGLGGWTKREASIALREEP